MTSWINVVVALDTAVQTGSHTFASKSGRH